MPEPARFKTHDLIEALKLVDPESEPIISLHGPDNKVRCFAISGVKGQKSLGISFIQTTDDEIVFEGVDSIRGGD